MTGSMAEHTGDIAAPKDGRPDASTAFELARKRFLAGERLDMQGMAAELGVDRTTLFRWVGNRDQLMIEILTTVSGPAINRSAESVEDVGGARIAKIAGNYTRRLITSQPFQAFLTREAERALRLLTANESPVQRQVVDCFEGLIQAEIDRGDLEHQLGARDLAYLVVRIIESFTYTDLITGEPPDAEKAEAAIAALLHARI